MTQEVLKLALEALTIQSDRVTEIGKRREAITAIKKALAQPDPYKQGYADAMNWKVQNHLEHLPTAQPEQKPFCYHDGRNIVGKEFADHSDVFPLYTSPNPEQQKPVKFKCTAIKEALAQTQEPVAWMHVQGNYKEPSFRELADDEVERGWEQYPLYNTPPQRTEQNFCSRCGKRVGGIDSIHTCTPPMENT